MVNILNYKNFKVIIFILTLRTKSKWREQLVIKNINNNKSFNIMYGIDGNNIELIKSIFKSLNLTLRSKKQFRKKKDYTYGKLGRWLSTILTAKICLDTGYNIILIEDDLEIPPNFDFKLKPNFFYTNGIVKFGQWGDAYFFNPNSSLILLQELYKRGINCSDDIFIKGYLKTIRHNVFDRNKFGYSIIHRGKEISEIGNRDKLIDFKINNLNSKKILITKRLFPSIKYIDNGNNCDLNNICDLVYTNNTSNCNISNIIK